MRGQLRGGDRGRREETGRRGREGRGGEKETEGGEISPHGHFMPHPHRLPPKLRISARPGRVGATPLINTNREIERQTNKLTDARRRTKTSTRAAGASSRGFIIYQ